MSFILCVYRKWIWIKMELFHLTNLWRRVEGLVVIGLGLIVYFRAFQTLFIVAGYRTQIALTLLMLSV